MMLAIAAATVALLSSADVDSVVVSVGGLKYRVQALSVTLLRLEAEGLLGGFEDRATFFAQNRSWAGVAITAHSFGFNATTQTFIATFCAPRQSRFSLPAERRSSPPPACATQGAASPRLTPPTYTRRASNETYARG